MSNKTLHSQPLMKYVFGNKTISFRHKTFENWVEKNCENTEFISTFYLAANYCAVRIYGKYYRFIVDEDELSLDYIIGHVINTKTGYNFLYETQFKNISKF